MSEPLTRAGFLTRMTTTRIVDDDGSGSPSESDPVAEGKPALMSDFINGFFNRHKLPEQPDAEGEANEQPASDAFDRLISPESDGGFPSVPPAPQTVEAYVDAQTTPIERVPFGRESVPEVPGGGYWTPQAATEGDAAQANSPAAEQSQPGVWTPPTYGATESAEGEPAEESGVWTPPATEGSGVWTPPATEGESSEGDASAEDAEPGVWTPPATDSASESESESASESDNPGSDESRASVDDTPTSEHPWSDESSAAVESEAAPDGVPAVEDAEAADSPWSDEAAAPAEDAVAVDEVSEAVDSEDVASEDFGTEETVSGETETGENPWSDESAAPAEDVVAEDVVAEDTVAEETVTEETGADAADDPWTDAAEPADATEETDEAEPAEGSSETEASELPAEETAPADEAAPAEEASEETAPAEDAAPAETGADETAASADPAFDGTDEGAAPTEDVAPAGDLATDAAAVEETADAAAPETASTAEPGTDAADTASTAASADASTRPDAADRGQTTVDEAITDKLVRAAVTKVAGVHAIDDAGTSISVDGDVATVTVAIIAEFGTPLRSAAREIRTGVIEALEGYLEYDVEAVNIHVSDIHTA